MSSGGVEQRAAIQPVWGSMSRKLSYGVLDTAENLLDNIDELSDVLDKLTEKYDHVHPENVLEEEEDDDDNGITVLPNLSKPEVTPQRRESVDMSMFRKLKTCLDSTRFLISSLRREKGRLMKREMSIECRMGEIEDYKRHMKQDLTSLNEFVDILSNRIIQLEDRLVDEQENYEKLQAENIHQQDQWQRAETLCKDLNSDNDDLLQEIKSLRMERQNNQYKIDALYAENHKLKELVREQCESDHDSGFSSTSEHRNGKQSLGSDSDSDFSCDLGMPAMSEMVDTKLNIGGANADDAKLNTLPKHVVDTKVNVEQADAVIAGDDDVIAV